MQKETGADLPDRHLSSRTASAIDRQGRRRQSKRKGTFDAGAVQLSELQSLTDEASNRID